MLPNKKFIPTMSEKEIKTWIEMAESRELSSWLYAQGVPDVQVKYLRRLHD